MNLFYVMSSLCGNGDFYVWYQQRKINKEKLEMIIPFLALITQ